MKNDDLKELLFSHIREMFDDAMFYKRDGGVEYKLVTDPKGSDVLDYTPFEEVGDQDNDFDRTTAAQIRRGDPR